MSRLRVSVAWASPHVQCVVEIDLPCGATVADAVSAANALALAGLDESDAGFAIYGQTARGQTPLADGDRVEITRRLVVDPKASRQKRAASHPPPRGPVRPRRPKNR